MWWWWWWRWYWHLGFVDHWLHALLGQVVDVHSHVHGSRHLQRSKDGKQLAYSEQWSHRLTLRPLTAPWCCIYMSLQSGVFWASVYPGLTFGLSSVICLVGKSSPRFWPQFTHLWNGWGGWDRGPCHPQALGLYLAGAMVRLRRGLREGLMVVPICLGSVAMVFLCFGFSVDENNSTFLSEQREPNFSFCLHVAAFPRPGCFMSCHICDGWQAFVSIWDNRMLSCLVTTRALLRGRQRKSP